jgi:hypothetical protein
VGSCHWFVGNNGRNGNGKSDHHYNLHRDWHISGGMSEYEYSTGYGFGQSSADGNHFTDFSDNLFEW